LDIPDEIKIKATIKPGTVFYFTEETFSSQEPHYFIVLNRDPLSTNVVILVCSSSQIEKVEKRIARLGLPCETAVKILESEYTSFTTDSIINCNEVFQRSIDQLVGKLKTNDLKIKAEMSSGFVEKLVAAVRKSPLVAQEVKDMLP